MLSIGNIFGNAVATKPECLDRSNCDQVIVCKVTIGQRCPGVNELRHISHSPVDRRR